MNSSLAFIPGLIKSSLIREGVKEEHAERIAQMIRATLENYE